MAIATTIQFCIGKSRAISLTSQFGIEHPSLRLEADTDLTGPEGIFGNPFERGEIGPDLFRAACDMGLEGLVSKLRDRPYQSGRSKFWVKTKNRKHPAMERVMHSFS
jgi:hypothetical protein